MEALYKFKIWGLHTGGFAPEPYEALVLHRLVPKHAKVL